MNTLPLILGAGVVFLVLNKPSSNSSSKAIPKIKPKRVGRKDSEVEESDYWTEDTELNVANQIKYEITKYKNKDLCSDEEKIVNGIKTFIANPNALKIVKTVITNLWKTSNIKESMLPPKENAPAWLFDVWTRVNNIYFEIVCGFTRS